MHVYCYFHLHVNDRSHVAAFGVFFETEELTLATFKPILSNVSTFPKYLHSFFPISELESTNKVWSWMFFCPHAPVVKLNDFSLFLLERISFSFSFSICVYLVREIVKNSQILPKCKYMGKAKRFSLNPWGGGMTQVWTGIRTVSPTTFWTHELALPTSRTTLPSTT